MHGNSNIKNACSEFPRCLLPRHFVSTNAVLFTIAVRGLCVAGPHIRLAFIQTSHHDNDPLPRQTDKWKWFIGSLQTDSLFARKGCVIGGLLCSHHTCLNHSSSDVGRSKVTATSWDVQVTGPIPWGKFLQVSWWLFTWWSNYPHITDGEVINIFTKAIY